MPVMAAIYADKGSAFDNAMNPTHEHGAALGCGVEEHVSFALQSFLAIDSDAHEILEELRWNKVRSPHTPRQILLRVRSHSLGRIGEDDGDEREASEVDSA
ncbi:hypothetical protein H310_05413 [Aphanomyces invadans]|uniref:Uncharacterized protein n=1 Tax=Aphanomyces invadans TaxID=157072 RepID=A0A024UAS1_9STRA|nr:hypothetical protein H310_05413 [Aphanomyces invadans]ETW02972.1 hypothetical protein H310_05413 [Aphanomyces invadans]|eukprot:XP_008868356.1 hypothetical protein H310_05413 [Aphanomyces invadans]